MKLYKGAWGKVEEKEVHDIAPDVDPAKPARYRERRSNLHAPYEQWFHTWDAAKAYLLANSKKEVDERAALLELSVDKDTKIKALKKP